MPLGRNYFDGMAFWTSDVELVALVDTLEHFFFREELVVPSVGNTSQMGNALIG